MDKYIDEILRSVGDVWKTIPKLRLGQLLGNAINLDLLYHMTDEELIEKLRKYEGSIHGSNSGT